MTTHELNGKTVGVVEVPSDAKDFHIDGIRLCIYSRMGRWDWKWLPSKGFKFLSLASDMTEEMAKMIMPKIFPELVDSHYYNYTPKNDFDTFNTALESLRSWERSKGVMTVNPYGDEPIKEDYVLESQYDVDALSNIYNKWSVAQQQVVNIAYLIKG